MSNQFLSPFPIHLAELEVSDGEAKTRKKHSLNVLYRQQGLETVQLFVADEMFDTEPKHLVDVDLQSWTFAIRKAYTLEGHHYLFYSKEYGLTALMTAKKDSAQLKDQTFITIRGKQPYNVYDFGDNTTVDGDAYFERIRERVAASE